MSKQKTYSGVQSQTALAALSGKETVAELSAGFGVRQTLIHEIGEPSQGVGGGHFSR